MATTGPLPDQQQVALNNNDHDISSSNARQYSGSIGPFFAVISVLTMLAFLSCMFGRIWSRREAKATGNDPLDSHVNHESCLFNEWFKSARQRFMYGFDVEIQVIKAKIFGERRVDCKVQDGVVQNHDLA